jgi:gluconate:H+ symporter, GntP family
MLSVLLLVLAIAFIVVATARYRLHPFLALLIAALGFGLASGTPPDAVVKAINDGFGATSGGIGMVILLGTIIGAFLERSGGTRKLAEALLRLTGPRQTPAAMAILGYVVSIPVFCDSGFVILSSLCKACARSAGVPIAVAATALALGLYTTHALVPPTPGPLGAAALLGADLGLVVLYGLIAAAVATIAGWLYATLAGRSVPDAPGGSEAITDVAAEAPAAWHAALPIAVPTLLIVLRSLAQLPGHPFGSGGGAATASFLGQPLVAMAVGVALALTLPRRFDRAMLAPEGWTGKAVIDAAAIIAITAAGGSFGAVLKTAGVADTIGQALAGGNLGLFLPFLIAAGIKTAQGSGTVSCIMTAGIVAPLLPLLGLDGANGRALAVLAIGSGAMAVSHANDSYFWVVSQFSGMGTRTGYRMMTVGSLVEAVAGMAATMALAQFVL